MQWSLLSYAMKLAARDLRGGIRGFRIFMACLALGVAAITAVGSVSLAIQQGLRADAKTLLGGDVDLRLTHRPATDAQLAWLRDNTAALSAVVQMRSMAVRPDGDARRLVELKAVDGQYPLNGSVNLESASSLNEAFGRKDGLWPVAVGTGLLSRLEVAVGDTIRVGEATFRIADVVRGEPDKGTQAFNLGPRILMPLAALPETGLVQPGSLIRYHYRISLPEGVSVRAWRARLEAAFPDAGWRVRDLENAAPRIQRFVERVRMFLTLVGMTALLVGGVGVGNAAQAYLLSKTGTIATLKCVGASSRLIFATYLSELMVLGLLGSVVGAAIGALAPFAVGPVLADKLPVAAQAGLYPGPVLLGLAFGLLTTLIFSLWPLARARRVSAAALFRQVVSITHHRPGVRVVALTAVLAFAMAGIAVLTADNQKMALFFVLGAAVTLLAFRGTAWVFMRLAASAPRPKAAKLRLALANIHRPGAPTGSIVLSLGLGLTVLATIALIEANLDRQVKDTLRGEAPGFYFIDIQPHQVEPFEALLSSFPGVEKSEQVPMLRGRIVAMDGTPVSEIDPPPDFAWILRGDRGVTWSRTMPERGSEVVAGQWWNPSHSGDTLVSFDVEAARAFDLDVGDTVTVNVLGRDIRAEIANLRKIDWTSLGINFVMIFSPGVLETAPQSYLATAHLPPERELALEKAVTDAFPNVSSIRVKEVLEGVATIIADLGVAVRMIAAVAILAGVLVLAGAIAAGHRRRIYDAVVLKVLGATRWDVMAAFVLEYLLLGLATALLAVAIGTVAAYGVMAGIMDAPWAWTPSAAFLTVGVALCATMGLGGYGAWRALGEKTAPYLRND